MTISKQIFTENTATRFGVSSGRNYPLSIGLDLEEFDENEHVDYWTLRDMVRCLMCLSNQTR